MRKALNENPMVQMAVVGVLILVAGIFLLTRMGGDEKAPAPTAAATATESAAAGTTAAPTGSTAPAEVVAPAGGSVTLAPAPMPPSSPEALVPGPGLPAEVVNAWKGGDALALLIVRGGGIDDRLVRDSVHALSGDPEVSVFVARAKNIARYARITQGVGVNRVPALVIVRPRRLSGGIPQAVVSYGFRDRNSVVQAVEDALYTGRDDVP